ncbi:hypothetical protein NQ314_018594 [Rhamnusium bicolor]|uniref:Uncharacterized protein n=1 Tax=Rhamnusium bicolor TaxID=1586634 RepID=A0AAV8WPT2_9CUCU|nr:hypothetical protein NQ314_018594 [Rhamnusium bicolor]
MNYDINNIPIQIEGVNLPAIPGPSSNVVDLESDINSDSADSDDSNEDPPKEKSRRLYFKKETTKLSPHLKGLMGEANLRYARGDLETAKKMCFEVIRQVPDAYEPYLTLSQMYETTNLKKI